MKLGQHNKQIITDSSNSLCRKGKNPFLLLFFLLCNIFAFGQTIWFVKANATGLNNGTSWANAFTDLQPALDAASASTDFSRQIWVAKGIYKPTVIAGNGTEERDKSFTLVSNVKLYGGFIGTEPATYDPGLRNIRANETILSGDIGAIGDNTDNSYHVVLSSGPLGAAILDGFTISGGNANGTTGPILVMGEDFERSYCGGLYNRQNDNTLTIISCTIAGNRGINYGGIYNFGSSPYIINSIIKNNIAIGRGNNKGGAGGLSNRNNSNPIVVNCLITGNKGDDGGGITHNGFCSATYINCTISGNTALGSAGENNDNATGGGIQNYGSSSARVYNSIVWGNTARADNNLSNLDGNSPFIVLNSIIEGGYTGVGNLNTEPGFVSFVAAFNAPTAAGDYHIKCNSPAIDAGNDGAYSIPPPTDLDGKTRIVGADIDMGVYEFQTSLSQTIVIQYITPGTPSLYCPGNSFNVGFTINDCPGNFAAGNVFTLQLSDASGSFSSPIPIGSLASISPGTITAAIPVNTPAGNGYRIRIISSNQSFTSETFNIPITILSNQTPTITISASSSQICAGDNVTFTAAIAIGGSSPFYQWKKNGNNVGTNSNSYSDNNLTGIDVITCELTNTEGCATTVTALSNEVSVTVATVIPAISITVDNVNICSIETANFNAIISGGGNNPAFQWKKNGVNVGGNVAMYSPLGLSSSDIITCELISSVACASPAIVLSNALQINVTPVVIPAIKITANKNEICPDAPVTFLATITNAGTNPILQWKKNKANVGTNSISYTDATLLSTDIISCELQSSERCALPKKVTSNELIIRVGLVTPTITIHADRNEICKDETVNFNAVISGGGNAPVYQWRKNGASVGTNFPAWSDAGLLNSDIISCGLKAAVGVYHRQLLKAIIYL